MGERYTYTLEAEVLYGRLGDAYVLERDRRNGAITAYAGPLTYGEAEMYRSDPSLITRSVCWDGNLIHDLHCMRWRVIATGGPLNIDQDDAVGADAQVGSGATIVGEDGSMLPGTVIQSRLNARGMRSILIQLDAVTEDGAFVRDIDEHMFTAQYREPRSSDPQPAEGTRWRTLDGFRVHFGERRSNEAPASSLTIPADVAGWKAESGMPAEVQR